MKTRLAALLFIFFFLGQTVGLGADKHEMEAKAILAICADWDNAYIKKDAAPLERILHPDYVGIDEEGTVTTKADEIALIKTSEYVIHSVEQVEPPMVRFYGNTAVVTTHAKVNQTYKGKSDTIEGRATNVCVKEGGAWKIVSWHASKLKGP